MVLSGERERMVLVLAPMSQTSRTVEICDITCASHSGWLVVLRKSIDRVGQFCFYLGTNHTNTVDRTEIVISNILIPIPYSAKLNVFNVKIALYTLCR